MEPAVAEGQGVAQRAGRNKVRSWNILGTATRKKTIALIDTRPEVPGETLGILVSTHPDVMAAFAANDAFQKAEPSGRHIRTKIVTLKDRLDVGQPVQPAHLAESK